MSISLRVEAQNVEAGYEDTKKVRVAGPFTVESLSPHRSLSFGGTAPDSPRSEANADQDVTNVGFEQMILES